MKKETYYLNEFTGEVLTDELKTLETERSEAKRIEDEVKQDYKLIQKLIQNFCDNHDCFECPFFHGNGTPCIANAFLYSKCIFCNFFEGD
jgi:hypothetical protein